MKTYVIAIMMTILSVSSTQATQAFSDSFEGDKLDSFWFPDTSVPHHKNSSYSLSTDYARTGAQSLKLSFDAFTQPGFYMGHYFDAPVQGTFSVWFYDTTFPILGGLYLDNVRFGNTTDWASVGVSYDNYFSANYGYWTSLPTTLVGSQSLGWHHFQISVTDAGSTYYLDDVKVGEVGPLKEASLIYLSNVIAGNIYNDGSHAVYYDDFSFTPSVPEPATMSLLSLGSLALLRRRK